MLKNSRLQLLVFTVLLFVSFVFFHDTEAVTGGGIWGPINCDPHGNAQFCSDWFQEDQANKQVSGFNVTIVTHGHGFLTDVYINICLLDAAQTNSAGCVGINVTNDDIGTNGFDWTFYRDLNVGTDWSTDWSWIRYEADIEDAHSTVHIDDTKRERAVSIDSFRESNNTYDHLIGEGFDIEWGLDWPMGGAVLNWFGAGVLLEGSGNTPIASSDGVNGQQSFTCSDIGTATFRMNASGPSGGGGAQFSLTQNIDVNCLPPLPRCGDGNIDAGDGEECDTPGGVANGSCPSTCSSACTTNDCSGGPGGPNPGGPNCGDGSPDPGEECDLGAANGVCPASACSTSCTTNSTCSPSVLIGNHEVADCTILGGWAFDPDTPSSEMAVHVYRDGPAGSGIPICGSVNCHFVMAASTTGSRGDVNTAYGITGSHGFTFTTPGSLKDGLDHDIYIHGIDNTGGPNSLLSNTPKTLNCSSTQFYYEFGIYPIEPTISDTTVSVNNSNYCGQGVHATVSGTYTDPGGSNGTAYEILVDDDLARDPNVPADFSAMNPEWESGTIIPATPIPNGGTFSHLTPNCPVNNSTNTTLNTIDARPQVNCQMVWSTTYTAWARVRNTPGQWSQWVKMITYCNGASCSPPLAWPNGIPNSWNTPVQAFPQVGFTFSPASPTVNTPVTFTDTTVFQGAATPITWLWEFDYSLNPPGTTQTITAPPAANGSTVYTYTANGTYATRLTATDNLGQSCSFPSVAPIGVQAALPQWREVAPR